MVVSKVADMSQSECDGLLLGWVMECGYGDDYHSRVILSKMRWNELWKIASMLSRGMRRLESLYTRRSQARIGFSGGIRVSSSTYDDGLQRQKTPLCKYTLLQKVRFVLKDVDYDIRSDQGRRPVGTT